MDLLPPDDELRWLLDALGGLIGHCGYEHFVRAPLLEPSPRFFPDPWDPSARGVRILALRLLRYAGITDLDVSVALFDDEQARLLRLEGVAAWFEGIEDQVARFGVNPQQLRDADGIVGTMCHEVAHAFRAYHGLHHEESGEEEFLTDVTTVYLGFGLLTTNASDQHRSAGFMGSLTVSEWKHAQRGYLLPQSMAYLLAVQATVRRLSSSEAQALGRLLEPNQVASFRAACKTLDAEALSAVLHVPAREAWPARPDLAVLAASINLGEDGDSDPQADGVVPEDDGTGPVPAPGPVPPYTFRLRGASQARVLGYTSLTMPFVAVLLVKNCGVPAMMGTIVAMTVLAMWVGSTIRRDTCSSPDCGAFLPEEHARCLRCGRQVRGEIDSQRERLAAEEEIEETDRKRRIRAPGGSP